MRDASVSLKGCGRLTCESVEMASTRALMAAKSSALSEKATISVGHTNVKSNG
jgi:hypothetical protein